MSSAPVTGECCAMCSRFDLKAASPDDAGSRWCDAWNAYKPWNGQAGVLFLRARDEAPRRAFAEKHKNNEMEKA